MSTSRRGSRGSPPDSGLPRVAAVRFVFLRIPAYSCAARIPALLVFLRCSYSCAARIPGFGGFLLDVLRRCPSTEYERLEHGASSTAVAHQADGASVTVVPGARARRAAPKAGQEFGQGLTAASR